jgi:hypothetical protein
MPVHAPLRVVIAQTFTDIESWLCAARSLRLKSAAPKPPAWSRDPTVQTSRNAALLSMGVCLELGRSLYSDTAWHGAWRVVDFAIDNWRGRRGGDWGGLHHLNADA